MLKRAYLTPRGARYRDVLVVVLTLCTGALDAVCFLRLGKVFSSVITGNLALLGIAVGEKTGGLAVNGGLTLAGYAAGVVLGTLFAGTAERGQPVWPRRVTVTLAVIVALVVGAIFGSVAATQSPSWVPAAVLSSPGRRPAWLTCAGRLNPPDLCRQFQAAAWLTSSGPLYSRSGMSCKVASASSSAWLSRA